MEFTFSDRTGGGEVVSRTESTEGGEVVSHAKKVSKEGGAGNPNPPKEEEITPRKRVPHR